MRYTFQSSSFSSFLWIKSGTLFKNPTLLNIEMENSGHYDIEVCTADGTVIGKATRPNPHAGWASFYFTQGGEFGAGIPDGSYKIKLINASSGTRRIRGGDLTYDN